MIFTTMASSMPFGFPFVNKWLLDLYGEREALRARTSASELDPALLPLLMCCDDEGISDLSRLKFAGLRVWWPPFGTFPPCLSRFPPALRFGASGMSLSTSTIIAPTLITQGFGVRWAVWTCVPNVSLKGDLYIVSALFFALSFPPSIRDLRVFTNGILRHSLAIGRAYSNPSFT
ncbi:hypothetical protein MVEN_00467800 [Mycena venus]|uniref:Uncharacterized protein n=1 Tax=Mycena venus TaxID=2733690 RepID=A0A8H6YW65_9AGAR|nr:hypothetical protein MVEN_00467800 [Mycena venus]